MMNKIIFKVASALVAVAGNLFFAFIFTKILNFAVFMDSIFTVAVTLFCGPVTGLATVILYHLCASRFLYPDVFPVFYVFCGMLTVSLTWYFSVRANPRKIVIELILLALILTLTHSILGGIISAFVYRGYDSFPIDYLIAGMLNAGVPLAVTEIVIRVPLNLIDKTLAVFSGYAIFMLAGSAFPYGNTKTAALR